MNATGCFELYFHRHGRVPSSFFELYLFVLNSISFDHFDQCSDAAIVDGTMVDTIGDSVAALNAKRGELGLAIRERTGCEHHGKDSEHLIHAVLRHVDAPPDEFHAEAFDRWQTTISASAAIFGAYPVVVAGL